MGFSCVMVVDDSEADQFLYKVVIEDCCPDVEVLQAYDGKEAMEVLHGADKMPEVIFLDINMPRMNGYEFLEAYQKEINEKSIVVVMLTSSDQNTDKEKALSYDCVKKYIEKPIKPEYLDEVRGILG